MKLTRNGKLGLAAVVLVAFVAAGAAFAATRIHDSSASSTGRGGFPGGPMGSASGYGPRGGFGLGPRGGAGGRGFGPGGRGGGIAAAATYLGLSSSDLFGKLQSGQSLADIARATSGKSVDGLVAAMVKAQKDELATAVQNGRLTQAQANQIEATLENRITQMVNGSFGGRPGFGGGGSEPPANNI